MPSDRQLTVKAQLTRASLIVAAAVILRESGPGSVTYRRVAEKASAASSSVGYYFDSIEALLGEAADYNMRLWSTRAERAAEYAESLILADCRENVVDLLLSACLPEEFTNPAAHYEQLLKASESPVVTEAYKRGRVRLDSAVERILQRSGFDIDPRLLIAVVDGAAVAGISEGLNVRENARSLIKGVLAL